MDECIVPRWLEWAREIQALSQTGQYYSENVYQRERYERLMAISAEIVSLHAAVPFEPVHNLFNAQTGYATPRVDVRGAVFKDGKLLMVRERSDGGWTLPGGWADVGDVPSEAAEREVWEEAGFKVKARQLIGVYDANRLEPLGLFHAFKITFWCEVLEGAPRPSFETSEVAFFGPTEIPEPLSGERTRLRQIVDAFALYHDPTRPAVFD